MAKLPLPKKLKTAVRTYAALKRTAQNAANEANREKTKLRNTIKDHWAAEKLPIGSFVRYDGLEVRYEATSGTEIDANAVLNLYEDGEVSREQFLRMISVGKSEAKNVLGGDQVEEFTLETAGDKVDVRITDTPVENIDDEFVMENAKVKRKVKRRVFGNGSEKRTTKANPRKQRRIKTRTKK